jgi:hypothetical protein
LAPPAKVVQWVAKSLYDFSARISFSPCWWIFFFLSQDWKSFCFFSTSSSLSLHHMNTYDHEASGNNLLTIPPLSNSDQPCGQVQFASLSHPCPPSGSDIHLRVRIREADYVWCGLKRYAADAIRGNGSSLRIELKNPSFTGLILKAFLAFFLIWSAELYGLHQISYFCTGVARLAPQPYLSSPAS